MLQLEDEITNNPLSKPEGSVNQNSAEVLYATMLPSLPQVSTSLLNLVYLSKRLSQLYIFFYLSITKLEHYKITSIFFQYMIALLKILLAAAPTSKAKTDSINIVTDVLPQDMP